MNQTTLVFHFFQKIFIGILFLMAPSSVAFSKDKACWVDFYEHSQYTGDHFRLDGPVQLENLNNVNGENWNSRIDSIKVGPSARVIVYENPNFKLTLTEMAQYPDLMRSLGITEKDIKENAELIFNANENIHDLSDFNFHHKVRSLKIECK